MAKRLFTSNLHFNYRDAHQYARENETNLASHRLLDEGVMSGKVRYSVQARESVAYPASGKIFTKKKDIVDPKTKTVIPLEFVKDLDIYRPGIGLFLDPKDLGIHNKTGGMVLLPQSIVILDNFIQISDIWVEGKPDENTRVPLAVSKDVWYRLSEDEIQWFLRAPQQSVRPLNRFYESPYYLYKEHVNATIHPSIVRGVALEVDARKVKAP